MKRSGAFLCGCWLAALIAPAWGDPTVRYTYDKSGNRLTAENQPALEETLAITDFAPDCGLPGDQVVIYGAKFVADAAANVVAFNGVAAAVLQAAPTVLVAQVPSGAASGPITVSNANGMATSPRPFKIQGIVVSPPELEIDEGTSFTFTATVTGLNPADVKWYVNEVEGGAAQTGTIDGAGIYTASQVNEGFSLYVTVSARIYTAPGFFIQGSSSVRIRNLNPLAFYEGKVVGVRKMAGQVEGVVVSARKIAGAVESKVASARKITVVIDGRVVTYRKMSDFIEGPVVSYRRPS